MKKLLLFLLFSITTTVTFAQLSISLTGYPLVTTGWLYGASSGSPAVVVDSTIRLTTSTGGTASYLYYNTAINMAGYCQWVADFDYKVAPVSGGVADGFAFWFLTTPPSSAAVTGSSIGLPNNPNGLILIFDTYNNNSAAGADNPLITLLGYNGTVPTYVEGSGTGVLSPVLTNQNYVTDATWHHCHVTYFMGNIRVYLNYSAVPNMSGYYPLAITGYFGFSASTGAVTSTQNVKRVAISVGYCLTPLNNGPLCQADTLKLQALGDSTAATYYWYGPNGFTSTLQNPFVANVSYADSGDYHVVKTFGGVHDTGLTHVSIKLNPIVTASGNSPVCVGNTISLTSGSFTTGETFSWSGPGVYSSTLQNPVIAPAAQSDTGYYTVIATLNGCKDTATVHIDVIHVPVPVAANNTPICAGSTVSLTASDTIGTVIYNWSGPGGFASTLQNPVIAGAATAASGIYSVIASIGVCTASDTTLVRVYDYPVVTAGSNSPVCQGSNILLTSGPFSPGETFSWSGPGVYTSAVENPVIAPAALSDTGFYTVIATLNGCSDTATVHVNVIHVPSPVASNNTPICAGSDVSLTATDTSSTVIYNWSGPGGFSTTVQNPVIFGATAAASGIYTVTVSIGVCTKSDTTLVTVDSPPAIPDIALVPPQCSQTTLNLFLVPPATVGAVYHWSGPNGLTFTGSTITGPSIPNIPTSGTGVYSVYATVGACTSITHTRAITIDSTPLVPIVTSNSPICSGIDTLFLHGFSNTAGVHYSWSGPASFSGTAPDTAIINPTASMSGNYTVTAILGICSSFGSNTVLINQTPSAPTLSSNSPVCSGGLLILSAFSAPTGGVYTWHGPNSYTSVLQNPQILNVTMYASGIYSVSETVNGCTSDTSYLNVIINPTPAIPVASSNAPICEGDTLVLHVTDDTLGVSYVWNGPNAFTSTSSDPFILNVTPAAQGVYTVSAVLGPCSATSITNVNITNSPTITATSNSPVCSGDTLKLFSSIAPGNTVAWMGPYTFLSSAPNPTRYPAITEYAGVYQVTVTGPGGCFAITYDTVVVHQTPAAPWVNWLTYCQYAYAPPLTAIDATNILWFTSSAPGGIGTTVAPIPPTNVPGVFFYYLNQTANGCTSPIDSVQVIVNPKPVITLNPVASFICPGDSVVYTATSTDPSSSFHWYPTIYLRDSLTANNVAHPIANQSYEVVASNSFGCADTAYPQITVFSGGLISLGIEDSVTVYPGESYHIIPSGNCVSFNWFPPEGLSNPGISDPTATPSSNTIYVVTVITDNGCIARDSIYFHVNEDNDYAIPNAFTPGTGVNNEFRLITKGIAHLNHFRIYNRWGQLVFETKNIDAGWDGSWKGEPQPFGVYVYDVEAVSSITGKIFKMHGNITLLR